MVFFFLPPNIPTEDDKYMCFNIDTREITFVDIDTISYHINYSYSIVVCSDTFNLIDLPTYSAPPKSLPRLTSTSPSPLNNTSDPTLESPKIYITVLDYIHTSRTFIVIGVAVLGLAIMACIVIFFI